MKQPTPSNFLFQSKKDTLFSNLTSSIKPFSFNKEVSDSFDDMAVRSIPFYNEIQKIILNTATNFSQNNTTILDCGCSTGTTLALLSNYLNHKDLTFIGLDYSEDMLTLAKEKLNTTSNQPIKFIQHDLNKGLNIPNNSVIILNLVLQFIKKENRLLVLKNAFDNLNDNGALILIEKILPENSNFEKISREAYEKFKSNQGYSKDEIENKKKALKNVLIPLKHSENIKLLQKAGFKIVETVFQWYNFSTLIAIKQQKNDK